MKHFKMNENANGLSTNYSNVSIPECEYREHDDYFAVRNSAVMADYSHYGIVKVYGDEAWLLLNHLVSADISSIRDEQLLYTFFLDENGEIISDAYVVCDNESYILISEWLSSDKLCQLVNNVLVNKKNSHENFQIDEVISLDCEWRTICLEGPYSWEILSEMFGMDIIGLPLHEYMYVDENIIIMRVGKHGEYCYYIMGLEEQVVEIWEGISQLTDKYDLKIGGIDYLRDVRLENPCWEPSVCNSFSRCPIELQMQWAISYDKDDFIGKKAIEMRAEIGVPKRIVGAKIMRKYAKEISLGDRVFYKEEDIGSVVNIGFSHTLKCYIARVFLKYKYAYVGIDDYIIRSKNGDVSFVTSSIPFINNLSSIVNPTEDSYLQKVNPNLST